MTDILLQMNALLDRIKLQNAGLIEPPPIAFEEQDQASSPIKWIGGKPKAEALRALDINPLGYVEDDALGVAANDDDDDDDDDDSDEDDDEDNLDDDEDDGFLDLSDGAAAEAAGQTAGPAGERVLWV